MGIDQIWGWVVTQATNWIGSETGGAAFLGACAPVVAALVGIILVKGFQWLNRRWHGEHLPVRETVQSLLDRMGSTQGWAAAKATPGEVISQSMTISAEKVLTGGIDMNPTLNRGERRRVQTARKQLLQLLAVQEEKRKEREAEQALRNALALSASIPASEPQSEKTGLSTPIHRIDLPNEPPAKGQTYKK